MLQTAAGPGEKTKVSVASFSRCLVNSITCTVFHQSPVHISLYILSLLDASLKIFFGL
jgi:hypothetical protein